MKALELEKMEQIEGGECGREALAFGVAILGMQSGIGFIAYLVAAEAFFSCMGYFDSGTDITDHAMAGYSA